QTLAGMLVQTAEHLRFELSAFAGPPEPEQVRLPWGTAFRSDARSECVQLAITQCSEAQRDGEPLPAVLGFPAFDVDRLVRVSGPIAITDPVRFGGGTGQQRGYECYADQQRRNPAKLGLHG